MSEIEKPTITTSRTIFRWVCILTLSVVLGVISIAVVLYHSKDNIIQNTNPFEAKKSNKTPYWNDSAVITYYQATIEQCENDKGIGYWGDTLKPGDCAVSNRMMDICNYKDSLVIPFGEFKGTYCLKDKSAAKDYHIDVFKPLSYKATTGKYYSKFKVL
jgi:hypothetical protein